MPKKELYTNCGICYARVWHTRAKALETVALENLEDFKNPTEGMGVPTLGELGEKKVCAKCARAFVLGYEARGAIDACMLAPLLGEQ